MADNADINVDDPDDFRNFIESEALKTIVELLDKGAIDDEKAKKLSGQFLDLIAPGMTVSELYENAVKLDDLNPEMSPVVFKIMKIYEEKFEKKALNSVSKLVKEGRFDDAEGLVKKVLQFKINQ